MVIKIRCIICKCEDELTRKDVIDAGSFIDSNELDVSAYLEYISLKKGKKCRGIEENTEKKKKHVFLFTEDTNNELANIITVQHNNMEIMSTNKNKRDVITSYIVKTQQELDTSKYELEEINVTISALECAIKDNVEDFKELTGSSKIDIWK